MQQDQNQNSSQVEVGIARIYIKDLSFESPKSPHIFQQAVQPELKIEVNVAPKTLQGQFFEVSLNILVEAVSSSEPVFVIEIEQAGVFEIKNASAPQLDHILTVFAPTTLFPYARAAIDQVMVQGSLPPLALAPVNFEAMRAQRPTQQPQGRGGSLPQ